MIDLLCQYCYLFYRQSIYYGPKVSGSSLIDESIQLKLKNRTMFHNLDNDDIFGKPMNIKWEKKEQ